ncbi:MAG: DUF4012 domain-containing protein [Gordonia polyisoprenivorans]|nr:DUF4012 domain-containing protein [Gordonia polyisoprenivorans]
MRWAALAVFILLVASFAWLLYSGYEARSELRAIRQDVGTLQKQISAGQIDDARQTASRIQSEANAAHSHTTGPVWAIGAGVPWLGRPLDSARHLSTAVDAVADHTLPALVDATHVLSPGVLRDPQGRFNLSAIARLAGPVSDAGDGLDAALAELAATPSNTWFGSVNTARADLISDLTPLRDTVTNLGRAIKVVPTVLGAQGPRRYMITFANDAEIRGTDGIAGAFVIARADKGMVTFDTAKADNYLVGTRAKGVDLGSSYYGLYQGAAKDYRDSTWSPNFPSVAKIWASMWQQKTGQTLDGSLVLDPTALGYLLAVTGPVTVDGDTAITSQNVVQYTQQGLYEQYPSLQQNDARKRFLLDLADAVSASILSPKVDLAGLLHAAGQGAVEHRLMFYSKDSPVERQVAAVSLGGTLPAQSVPFVGIDLTNESQSKLDYYLHARLDVRRTGCGATRDVIATLTLANDSPSDLPKYVIGNSGSHRTETLDVTVLGSEGTKFRQVQADGRTPFHSTGADDNHPGYTALFVPIKQGGTVQIVFSMTQPAGHGPLVVRAQPMINPMTTSVEDATCGTTSTS